MVHHAVRQDHGLRNGEPSTAVIHHRQTRLEPEERLLLAVLEEAVHELDSRYEDLRRKAAAYLAAEEPWWPFSFVRICQYFDLDGEKIRQALNKTTRHAVHGTVRMRESRTSADYHRCPRRVRG